MRNLRDIFIYKNSRQKYLPVTLVYGFIPGVELFLSVLIVLLTPCIARLQHGMNITYDAGKSSRIHAVEYSNNHKLFISGLITESDTSLQTIYVASLDTLGNILDWASIRDPEASAILATSPETSILLTDDDVAIVSFNFLGRKSIGVGYINPITGSTIKEYYQDSALVAIPQDIEQVQDGYLICGVIQFTDFNADVFVLKLMPNGNVHWMKTFGHPVFWENARNVIMLNENEFVISGTRYQWDQEPIFYHGWVYAIDSLGNKKWEWEASEEEIPHRGIMSMQYDSVKNEWVYVSFLEKPVFIKELGFNVDMQIPVFVRRDSLMQLITYQEYGPYSLRHYMGSLESSNDGSWLASGNFSCVTEDSPQNCDVGYGRVIKISNDVDTILWSVKDTAFYHPEHGSNCYLSGVTESPTGSVYAVGWANHYDENEAFRSFGWLLKITKDGCVDTLCTTTSLLDQLEKREKKIHVYPNPATDYLIFEIDESLDVVYVEIYDLSGRRIQYQRLRSGSEVMLLDDGRFSAGMYVWRVVDARGRQVGAGKVFVE